MHSDAAQSLQQRVDWLSRIFQHANDAILVIDPDNDRIIEANGSAARMLGYDGDELTDDVRVSSVHPHEMEKVRAFADDVRSRGHGWTNELSCRRKDGHRLPSEISASVVELGARKCIVAMVRDVSERKAAEDALRKSEQRFRGFVENAGDGFFQVGRDGRIADVNARAAEMLGYEPRALIGRSVLEIDAGLSPETFARLTEELEIDRPRLLESRHRRRDGSVFPSEVSICAYGSSDDPRYIALLRDVSRRKEADAAMARLAEMGELAAMIVHQIRNPLATINLCLEHLERQPLQPASRKRVTLAAGEAERLGRLLNEVLGYAGRDTGSPTDIAPDALIEQLLPALQSIPAIARSELRFEPGLADCSIRADREQFAQVISNLLCNACEAERGAVRLVTGRCADTSAPYVEVRNGGDLIPPDLLARIGQPFFSTKASGTGLGVAYVKRIAAAHHWQFTLTSTPAEGTIARLVL